MTHTAENIMTASVYTLTPEASVADAMKLSKEQNIRHIPVIDSEYKLVGIVSQKSLFNKALHLLSLYGTQESVQMEQETNIKEVMETEYLTVSKDKPLTDLIQLFKKNRHGCLPVISDNKKLLGLITSNNFVDYCETLLQS
ncbi:CBS domain-containing protein [Paraneptunicella aestuarii]|uniref:CBS domain-containing protein n=1 Tax=Paraneptunicella aestuarii TaxID=2831148 RepID=UPI001E5721C6|nr:CBS domain-containing protein [Paraneptunicella aestuarii]UAA40511.1 CBS domain-containing protein [Paraneptunicella aestuarii]